MTSTVAAGERPWLASYPSGVPAEVDVDAAGTVVDIFTAAVKRYPQRPMVESFGVRRSYERIGRDAGRIASWLASVGIAKGDRVAILLPNVMAFPAIFFGALAAGAAAVNLNPQYTPAELVPQLKDCGARVVFVLENFAAKVQAALAETAIERVVIVSPGDLLGLKGFLVDYVSRRRPGAVPPFRIANAVRLGRVLRDGGRRPAPTLDLTPDDVAMLQYTGGTTGIPKGVRLTHRNIAANITQCERWLHAGLPEQQHIMVAALPFFHIFGLIACSLVMMRIGACSLLVSDPRDIKRFVKLLQTRPFTCISGVNTLYRALANARGAKDVDWSRLVFCVAGGMATQEKVATAWKALTGHPIIEGYGLSETSPVLAINRLDIEAYSGSIGFPLPSTRIVLRGEDGREVGPGEPGELCARGPQVMGGYWDRPEETAAAFTPDGFFRTGDVAVMATDGSFRIVDRLKDVILVSGYNVYPNEVEDVISAMPGVSEAAVVGGKRGGGAEIVEAHVVRSDPAVTEADVVAWCRDRLVAYKRPGRVVFHKDLPKTTVGKVLRRALRDKPAGAAKADPGDVTR